MFFFFLSFFLFPKEQKEQVYFVCYPVQSKRKEKKIHDSQISLVSDVSSLVVPFEKEDESLKDGYLKRYGLFLHQY